MKQWIRKAVLCLSLVLSVLLLGACGKKTESEPLIPFQKEAAEAREQQYLMGFFTSDAEQLDKQLRLAEMMKDAYTYNGLTNYINSGNRLGAFVCIDSAEAKETENGYEVEVISTFEKRKLHTTVGRKYEINDDMQVELKLTELSFSPDFSMGELMADALGNLVVGMGTVFLMLILIAWIISLLKYVHEWEDRKKKGDAGKKPQAAAVKPAQPKAQPAAVTRTAPAAAGPDMSIPIIPIAAAIRALEEEQGNTELLAVIAAAIMAYEEDMGGDSKEGADEALSSAEKSAKSGFKAGPTLKNGLVVRSIRRR